MSTPLAVLSRLEAQERQIAELQQQLRELLGRLSARPAPREVFLAKAIAGVDEDLDPEPFPETGNTFNFQLVDRAFARGPGSQTTADTPRTDEQLTVGRTIDGRWLLENEPYLAIHVPQPPGSAGDKGEWWLIDQPRIEIVLVSSLIKSGPYYPGSLLHAAPDGTITSVTAIWILDLNEDA